MGFLDHCRRDWAILCLTLLLASTSAIADDSDVERLSAAYSEYKAALESGDIELEIVAARKSLDVGSTFYDESDPSLVTLRHNYAHALLRGGRTEQARKQFLELIDNLIEFTGTQNPKLIGYYMMVAQLSGGFGKEKEQNKWFERALNVASGVHGVDSVDYAQVASFAGIELFRDSNSLIGEEYIEQALAIYESELGERSLEAGMLKYQLGQFAYYGQEYREASIWLLDALSIVSGDSTYEQEQRLHIRALLVQNYELLGESDNATRHCIAIGRENQLADDQEFIPLFRPDPQYPRSMIRNRIEGHVVLSFSVDENGFVRNPEVVDDVMINRRTGRVSAPSGFRDPNEQDPFVDAALNALERYRYAPKFVDGIAVPVHEVKTRIIFRIDE